MPDMESMGYRYNPPNGEKPSPGHNHPPIPPPQSLAEPCSLRGENPPQGFFSPRVGFFSLPYQRACAYVCPPPMMLYDTCVGSTSGRGEVCSLFCPSLLRMMSPLSSGVVCGVISWWPGIHWMGSCLSRGFRKTCVQIHTATFTVGFAGTTFNHSLVPLSQCGAQPLPPFAEGMQC